MTRTYYIRYENLEGLHYDKIKYTSVDDRPRWHKVGALNKWKESHKGYQKKNISDVLTVSEYKAETK